VLALGVPLKAVGQLGREVAEGAVKQLCGVHPFLVFFQVILVDKGHAALVTDEGGGAVGLNQVVVSHAIGPTNEVTFVTRKSSPLVNNLDMKLQLFWAGGLMSALITNKLGPDVLLHVVQVQGGLEPGVIGALVTVEQTTSYFVKISMIAKSSLTPIFLVTIFVLAVIPFIFLRDAIPVFIPHVVFQSKGSLLLDPVTNDVVALVTLQGTELKLRIVGFD